MRHNAADARNLRSRKAAPQRIRKQSRTQTAPAPGRINGKPANQQ
jgi:hypothetical protein